jgi:peptidoglycan/xylan/chitin deacetylase (PgdA/CDA1 family)
LGPNRLLLLTGLSLVLLGCGHGSSASDAANQPSSSIPDLNVAASPEPTATGVPTATPLPPTAAPRVTRAPGEVVRGDPNRPEVALTFDCGASGVPTPAILDALRAAGLHVTFFITGQWATLYPDLTRRIAAEHEIANHSWSHPDFLTLNDGQILAEMTRGEEALNRIAGVNTKPLWRAPFGSRNSRLLALVRDAGWPYEIYWTADSGDWLDISPAQVRANVSKGASNGAIIVEHCGSTQTAAVLPQIIGDLQGRGLRIVTVSELLRD